MKQEKEEKSDLYIPINIRKRKEYIDGFGQKELIQTMISSFVGIPVGAIAYIFLPNIMTIVFMPVLFGGTTAVMTKKGNGNRSTVDSFKAMFEFNKEQRRYYYKYTNIYEVKEYQSEKEGKFTSRNSK